MTIVKVKFYCSHEDFEDLYCSSRSETISTIDFLHGRQKMIREKDKFTYYSPHHIITKLPQK